MFNIFERLWLLSEEYKKYRPWMWLVTFFCFFITSLLARNTDSSWVLLPFIIGCVTLFPGTGGEYFILSFWAFRDDPFIKTTVAIGYAIYYPLVGFVVMAIASGFASLVN
jgi:hypothetical protein